MANHEQSYYVPEKSYWPILGSISLIFFVVGAVNIFHENVNGWALLGLGGAGIIAMLFGWFSDVIRESHMGLYDAQMDRSFRWGMTWFIFSEVMFFAAFFGALFYARVFSVPWLGGLGDKGVTNMLWPQFEAAWPLLVNPNPERFVGPDHAMGAWGLPALNTLILLTSGATITWAHWGLKTHSRSQLNYGLAATVGLGILFLVFQGIEYVHAYRDLGLTLSSGIYGSTFFMLTGFHGMHVTLGTIMLIVILLRCLKGHFSKEKHFAFEAVAWYWHFVDVVWLGLFIFVYLL